MKIIKWFAIGMATIAGLFTLLLFIGFGSEFLHYSWAESRGQTKKMEKATVNYLSEKYKESFEIREVRYSRPFGDKEGTYTIEVNPAEKKHLLFFVHVREHFKQPQDNYKEEKWRQEAKELLRPLVNQWFPQRFGYMVNMDIENEEKYSIYDAYAKIVQEQPNKYSLYVFIYPYINEFTDEIEEKEMNRLFELYKYMQSLELKDFLLNVQYLQTTDPPTAEAAEFEYEEVKNQQTLYIFELDTRELANQEKIQAIRAPEDLLSFGRFIQR